MTLQMRCSKNFHSGTQTNQTVLRPNILNNGEIISFPENYPGLKRIETRKTGNASGSVNITAPARVVVTVNGSSGKGTLFDSPELTTLFAQYRTALINSQRALRTLTRAKDLFESQLATQREVSDAESEVAATSAAVAEASARLRGYGIDPAEIGAARKNIAWLVADIPETQLGEIRNGQKVSITLAALPEKKIRGRIDAIGDSVDPLTRSARLRISLANTQGKVKPGMFAQIDFGETRTATIVLPASAVITVENQSYVFVRTGERQFTRRHVTVWPGRGETVGVASGISANDEIVIEGTMLLKGLSFGY